MKSNKVYLYLGRRDKKGIKILSSFKHPNKYFPTRVTDLKQLNLSDSLYDSINKEVIDNKMLYELWIESSESFENLKKSLLKRGYSNLPLQKSIIYTTSSKKENVKVKQTKSMLRKNSDPHRFM